MKSRLAQLRSDVSVSVVLLVGAFVLITLAIMPQPTEPSKDSQSQSQPTATGV